MVSPNERLNPLRQQLSSATCEKEHFFLLSATSQRYETHCFSSSPMLNASCFHTICRSSPHLCVPRQDGVVPAAAPHVAAHGHQAAHRALVSRHLRPETQVLQASGKLLREIFRRSPTESLRREWTIPKSQADQIGCPSGRMFWLI